jgi:hypothetical protein
VTLYARTYFRYGGHYWDTDPLDQLVSAAEYMEDDGQGRHEGFWKLVDGEWVSADEEAKPLIVKYREEEKRRWSDREAKAQQEPWAVDLLGPAGAEEWWLSAATEDQAHSKAQSLPEVIAGAKYKVRRA